MNQEHTNPAPTVDILIVEDSETQAAQIEFLLSSEGYRVHVASNGLEGLAAAKLLKPTLVVSDISMPEMDGFAMCQQIKKDPELRDIPVILLTSLTSLYDVIKGLDCGADNFIRKPFEGKALLGRIRFILANRAVRNTDRVQLGMQISLGGQTHFVTAERQQIFDLLISTYEEAIQMTEALRTQQHQIAHSYQSLEGLFKIAEALNPAITERAVVDMALERVLEFPGVIGGAIKLLDHDGKLHVAAMQDFCADPALLETCTDCTCMQKLATGELAGAQLIDECKVLAESSVQDIGGHSHISVPLMAGETTRGIMNLLVGSSSSLIDDDFQVLDTVGSQIGIALERAHLYANMEALVKERTEALEAEKNLLSAVVNTTGALVLMADVTGRIVMFNPACESTFGWKFEEVRNRPYWEYFHRPDSAELVRQMFHDHQLEKFPTQVESAWLTRDGRERRILWSTSFLRGADGAIEFIMATGIDITEQRGAEEKIEYLSNFDSLTGLPNRVLLRDRMKELQGQVVAGKSVMGFLLIRFERLELIRESLGVKAEQNLLIQIAKRFKEGKKSGDIVARLSDNGFAIAVIRPEPSEFSAVARQILAVMDPPFRYDDQELHLDARIGISVFPNDGDNYEALVQCAEAARRRAVSSRNECYEFYRSEHNRGASERFKLESALRRALGRDEFRLHYQPQVDLTTGKIIGVEALLRWQHPELGLISPGRFIGLAEETGLILPIGEWVLRKACEQSCAWQKEGLRKVPIAVNLSAKQFGGNIASTVKTILAETGLDPTLLELELTESLSMEDPESTFEILRALKEMGVQLAIDDFGTGYSNLNYLKRFPVDKLKLDQSFVRDLISDPDDLSISRAVIAMAHSLRLKVIAEGIETEGQLALLGQSGCDEMQGFLFSRPVESYAFATLLREDASLALDKLTRRPYARSLLFVDDEANMVAAMRRTMRNKGYNIYFASNASQAFEILATTEIGVILCDQRMPGMSGTEFLSRVKNMYPSIVRMVLSGYTDLQSVTDAVNHGAIFKFLTKPWEEEDLMLAVREAFNEFESKEPTLLLKETA